MFIQRGTDLIVLSNAKLAQKLAAEKPRAESLPKPG